MARIGVSKKALHRAFDAIKELGFFSEREASRACSRTEVESWANLPAVPVSNCGMGLFAILRCLPKRSGIAVVATNTFFATGAMAKEAGYDVVGADCSRTDFCLTVETLERYAPGNTDVVILTHVGGGLASEYETDRPLVHRARHLPGRGRARTRWASAGTSMGATRARAGSGRGGVQPVRHQAGARSARAGSSSPITPASPISCAASVNYGKSDAPERRALQRRRLQLPHVRVAGRHRLPADEALPRNHGDRARRPRYALSRVVEPLVKFGTSRTGTSSSSRAEFPTRMQTGKVYAASDQLTTSCRADGTSSRTPRGSRHHKCLPIDEGLYDGMSSRRNRSKYLGV